ncbi:MAG: GldG family protein [Magnetococcales bacterium]|nr:GldG family protein [Magnetococcales bacterium]MBF0322124.1 GldG family protein [Magnetococcales bacterium]
MRMNRSTRLNLRTQNLLTGLLLALLFIVAAYATNRYPRQWDWTNSGRHTLAEQSVKAVQAFDKGLSATVFLQEDKDRRREISELLEKYRVINPKLTIQFINPDSNPALARQESIATYGTVLLRANNKSEKITETTEESVTNALIRLQKGTVKILRFLTGHGEHPLSGEERASYQVVAQLLRGEGYQVQELNLASEEAVPADTTVVVVAGPAKSLLPMEVERLEKWLQAGKGRALIMRDPRTQSGLEKFLLTQGISFQEGVVIDPVSRLFGAGPTTPIISQYDPSHPITKDLKMPAVLAEACGINMEPTSAPNGPTRTRILAGADRGWLEAGDISSGTVEFNPDKDLKGPIWMGVTVQEKDFRLAVTGDSDFASNAYIQYSGNDTLFLNTVRWLAEDESFIAIKPKKNMDAGLSIPGRTAQFLFLGALLGIPLILVGTGVVIWSKRRRK